MADRRYTIIIVPETGTTLRKLRISSRFISSVIIGLACLLVAGLGTMVHYIKMFTQAQSLQKVQQENVRLKANLKQSEVLTQRLNRKVSELSKLSIKLKAMAGLPRITAKKEPAPRMGMGGVRMDNAPDSSELTLLENRAESLEKSLLGLHSYLEKNNPFSTPSIPPSEGFISSSFGVRRNPFTSLPDFHEGLDISNEIGTPIVATANGVVRFAGTKGSFGRVIEVQHEHGISTLFGHLAKVLVQPGDQVTRGETIGLMGNTGKSTGPHLHYEVRVNDQPVNPKGYLVRKAE
jgi:murein DD-endopeptidase MepM/ murein hydrolase activator NlpD